MKIHISNNRLETGAAAAAHGATLIRAAIKHHGAATVIVATGASQFEMIDSLVKAPDIAWDRVTAFHLDEYVGLPATHAASFRRYLWLRFQQKLPLPLKAFHYISGEDDIEQECARLGALIVQNPIDVCFAGIGENAHLAFNDPPADFVAEQPYLVVTLDEPCRRQQLGEGWFSALADVPRQAISMSIRQIMKSKTIIVTAPDQRKARAVRDSVEGPVTHLVPSSILQQHSDTHLYLDSPSASLLATR